MKTRYYLWLALFAFLFVASCQKAPELSVTGSTSIEIKADGGSSSVSFIANRDWTVSCSESWVHVSPSSGSAADGQITVTVRCDANTTYEDRSATITIKAEDLTQTISVRQTANLGIIVPTKSYDLTSNANTIEIEVQSNTQYSVSVSDNWVKQTGTKGLTKNVLVFSVDENTSYDNRSATISIKPQNATVQEQVISVKQAQNDALSVEKTSYEMPYGGGGIEVKVEANVSFDVTPNVAWIHYVSTKALSNSIVSLTIDENTTYSTREGKIEIKQKNGSLSHTITVKQVGRIAVTSLSLNKTELNLAEGDVETLVATVKPDNATDKTVTWSTSDDNIASVDDNGKVTAIKEGAATITAKAGDKSAICSISVASSSIPDGNIVFADSNIKTKLVAAFDSNKDGELSYREVAAVTSLDGVFVDETSFIYFNEFQFFTGLSSVERGLFKNWFQLKQITLPETITVIKPEAFYNCYNLEKITFPASVERIQGYAFYGCSSLSGELVFPEGIIEIGSYAFTGCSTVSGDLVIPPSKQAQGIGEHAFSDCSGLTGRLVLPMSNTIYISAYAFSNCNFSGDLVVMPNIHLKRFAFSGVRVAGSVFISGDDPVTYHAYEYATIGENLIIQDDVKWLSQHPFIGISVGGYIYLGNSLVSISAECFDRASFSTMYVAAPTPPACEGGLDLYDRYLGVPKGRREVYKNTSPWKNAKVIEEVDFSTIRIQP